MKWLIAGLAALLLCWGEAKAGPLGVDYSSATSYGGSVWNLGYEFHVNNAVTVVALGNVDVSGSGYSQAQQVGLWTSSGVLLASTFVDNTDPLNGHWRFRAVSSVTLVVGQDYVVGAQGGADYTGAGRTVGLTVDPDITYVQDRFVYLAGSSNNPLVFPGSTEGQTVASGGGWFGGNVEFGNAAVIPEPASMTLFGIGALGLVGYGWRRRKTMA
jgi:hypothetical protein